VLRFNKTKSIYFLFVTAMKMKLEISSLESAGDR